jgi:hypothetical protein
MGIVAWGVLGAIADIGRFPSRAHAMGGSLHEAGDPDTGPARDGGQWRGPSEAPWIVQLLLGLPPPRDSAHALAGLVAHG